MLVLCYSIFGEISMLKFLPSMSPSPSPESGGLFKNYSKLKLLFLDVNRFLDALASLEPTSVAF